MLHLIEGRRRRRRRRRWLNKGLRWEADSAYHVFMIMSLINQAAGADCVMCDEAACHTVRRRSCGV
jgi:hypothetical protein